MLDPNRAFSLYGGLAVVSWVALAASLFVPVEWRSGIWIGTGLVVPALVGVGYAVLLIQGLRARTGGGFGSIAAVRQLFFDDSALAAGWLHYIAFDLFVGTWIARVGTGANVSPFLILPCLALTFLFGPAGILTFLVLRSVVAPHLGLTL